MSKMDFTIFHSITKLMIRTYHLGLFIIRLPARVLDQINNCVFHDLFAEHGFFLLAPTLLFFYLFEQTLLKTDDNNEFVYSWLYQVAVLGVAMVVLNCNHCLVDRRSSKYLISRSKDPKKIDSILDECKTGGSFSTKINILLWETFKTSQTPGHLAAQLFDLIRTYMSMYPGGEGVHFRDPSAVKQPIQCVNSSLSYDCKDENPDYIIQVPEGLLDEKNIQDIVKWFHSVADGSTGIYKGKFKNCADTINQALKAGNFHLANPSLRWMKAGISIPNDTADRIVYTICLKDAHWLIRLIHHILTMTVWMISIHFYFAFLCYIRYWISDIIFSFVLQGVFWFKIFYLFRALD